MTKRFASLLSADAGNYKELLKKIENINFDGIHFDIMDGHFVKNFAFSPGIIKSLRNYTILPFNAHLEIENPSDFIDTFIDCGCSIITLHPQTCNIERELRYLRARNVTASVAIDPDIKISEIFNYLGLIDNIIIMTVYPGFGKQKFIENSFEKIKNLKEIIIKNKLNITISVDGSVSKQNEQLLINSGCDILIYGSSLFN